MEQFAIFMQCGEDARCLFDQYDAGCAARGGLEAQRTAAGEEVEAMPALEFLAKPVEQGLANAVRRWAQAFAIGELEDAAAKFAADDAYRVQSAATVTVIRSAGRTRRAKAALMSSTVTACTLAWNWSR